MSGWLRVSKWETFQHYGDKRNPVWIKNYIELLHDEAYLGLTLHQRGVLHGVWLSYAAARRQLPDSTAAVSRRLGERVTRATLDALIHAGFLEVSASKALASCEHSARPEEDKEVDKEPLTPSEKGNGKSLRDKGWNPRAQRTNPRAVAKRDKRHASFAAFVSRSWEDYPNTEVLIDELCDRGCARDEAETLVEAERGKRLEVAA